MATPTENTVFNHCTRLPDPRAANSGTFHERYLYPPSAVGSTQSLPSPSQYAPLSYDQHFYPRGESSRAAFKRKSTSAFPVYQNDPGHCSSWISTTDPPNNFHLKPVPEFCCPQSSTSIPFSYPSDNLLYTGEQRNVRRRDGDTYHYPAWQPSSRNLSHPLYPLANNFSPDVVGQSCHPLPGTHAQWIHPIGTGCSSYTMDQSVAGNVFIGGNLSNHGAFQYSLSPSSQYPMYRGTEAGPSRYSHRQIPRRTSSSYPNLPFKDTVPFGAASVALPRNPMPFVRDRGLRISNEVQPLFDENNRVRWPSQVPDMMDVAPYFNPLDPFDEHRNLRLDIDAMSYEELLALEERIGNVNTGLSEEDLPSCVTASVFCSSTPDQEDLCEASCSICLEEYRDDDSLGKMKCLHVFHASCIKEWLRMKNACPICKAPALDDILKKR